MTTQPTPEQLAKWREEFLRLDRHTDIASVVVPDKHNYLRLLQHARCDGYLRAKQETEQALKDSRKQALEEALAICKATCDPYNTEHGNGYNRGALDCEKRIKELL